MAVGGRKDRRSAQERRKQERRRSVRYSVDTIVVIDSITWVDSDGSDRRRRIRRREDREAVAKKRVDEMGD
jgi:hypothetical protein